MDIIELQSSFKHTLKQYTALKNAEVSAVVREEWASGPLYNIEPLEAERAGEMFGKVLSKKPIRTNGKICYCFDSHGKIVTRRIGTSFADQFYEEFFRYQDNGIWSAYFGSSKLKELINVKFRDISEGKVTKVSLIGKRGSRVLNFRYEKDVLIKIEVREFKNSSIDHSNLFETHVSYGTHGEVIQLMNIFPNGYREQIFPTIS